MPSPTDSSGQAASPLSAGQRLKGMFPPGQVVRYLIVGIANTFIGYAVYAAILFFVNRAAPARFLYLTVIAASVLATPITITISYLNYKFFVFRTRGDYLGEWLRAFGVYGISMLPGLLALSALTRLLQSLLHGYAPLGKGTEGYVAGALVTVCSTVVSFIGHRKVTFRAPSRPV